VNADLSRTKFGVVISPSMCPQRHDVAMHPNPSLRTGMDATARWHDRATVSQPDGFYITTDSFSPATPGTKYLPTATLQAGRIGKQRPWLHDHPQVGSSESQMGSGVRHMCRSGTADKRL
jgi:hypothetical protein